MPAFFLRPKAISDLERIWDYTLEKWGVEQAEHYLRMINESFALLATDPSLGRSCDSVRPGYFRHRVGRHAIFYRVGQTGIEVVRVLHLQMDPPRHL